MLTLLLLDGYGSIGPGSDEVELFILSPRRRPSTLHYNASDLQAIRVIFISQVSEFVIILFSISIISFRTPCVPISNSDRNYNRHDGQQSSIQSSPAMGKSKASTEGDRFNSKSLRLGGDGMCSCRAHHESSIGKGEMANTSVDA